MNQEDLTLQKALIEATACIRCIDWSSDFLAAGGHDQKVRVYDTKDHVLSSARSICSVVN